MNLPPAAQTTWGCCSIMSEWYLCPLLVSCWAVACWGWLAWVSGGERINRPPFLTFLGPRRSLPGGLLYQGEKSASLNIMGNNRRKIWVFALGSFLGLLLLGSAIHPTLPWMSSPDPVTATVEKPGPGLAIPNHSLLSQEFQVPHNLSSLIASWSPENAVRERARRTPPLTPAQLEKLIKEYARRHGLDESLVWAVVRHESGFNCRAVAANGAMGLMPLMPATAVLVGVKDPFNAEENIAGGVNYLQLCLTRFGQDVARA